jgi:hypothetical protein
VQNLEDFHALGSYTVECQLIILIHLSNTSVLAEIRMSAKLVPMPSLVPSRGGESSPIGQVRIGESMMAVLSLKSSPVLLRCDEM